MKNLLTCSHCHKKYEEPLILYDGRRACPKCLAVTSNGNIDKKAFCLSKENHELYVRAKVLYLQTILALAKASSANVLEEKDKKSLSAAFSFARESYEEGNPASAILLSYLYRYGLLCFLGIKYSDKDRLALAGSYLAQVLDNPVVEDREGLLDKEPYPKLREVAAYELSALLHSCKKDGILLEKDAYNAFVRSLHSFDPVLYGDFAPVGGSMSSDFALLESIFREDSKGNPIGTLSGIDQAGHRAPLLMVLRLESKNLEKVLEEQSIPFLSRIARKGDSRVHCYLFAELGGYRFELHRFQEDLSSYTSEKYVYLCVANLYGKHEASYRGVNKISDYEETLSSIVEIADRKERSYIFSDDDLSFFKKKGRKFSDKIAALKDSLQG